MRPPRSRSEPGSSAGAGTRPTASALTRVTVPGAASDFPPRGAAAQGRARTGRAVPHTRDVCLATAVTDTFVPGAVVMLDSFRAHHPDFEGDVVILHGGLSEASRTILEAAGGRVRFEPVRPALLERVAHLWEAYPNRVQPATMFYTLDAFRLGGYRKVLYYDSDMLFQEPVGELFGAGGEALLCCGDWPCLMGRARDAETYRPLERGTAEADRPVLERTFNGGFLLIDGYCTGERVYADLLARMVPEAWRSLAIRLGDQCILNHYLRRPPDAGELDVQLPRLRCSGDPRPHGPRCRAGQGAAFQGSGQTVDAGRHAALGARGSQAPAPAGGNPVQALVRRLPGRPGADAPAHGAVQVDVRAQA